MKQTKIHMRNPLILIKYLLTNYNKYEIEYSKDGLCGKIGDFNFTKEFTEDVSATCTDKTLCEQDFNTYHIQFESEFGKLDQYVNMRDEPIFFNSLLNLDRRAHSTYKKRQVPKQLIASIKSFPEQIARKLGWER